MTLSRISKACWNTSNRGMRAKSQRILRSNTCPSDINQKQSWLSRQCCTRSLHLYLHSRLHRLFPTRSWTFQTTSSKGLPSTEKFLATSHFSVTTESRERSMRKESMRLPYWVKRMNRTTGSSKRHKGYLHLSLWLFCAKMRTPCWITRIQMS